MNQDVSIIILYNNNKEILLQKRTKNAKRSPGKWGFFGGGIENHENKYDAVIREANEELSYVLNNPQYIGKKIISGKEEGTMYIFSEEYDENQEIILGEGETYGWFQIKDIEKLDMISHDKEALNEIIEKLEF